MLSVQHKFFKRKKASAKGRPYYFNANVAYFNFSKSEALGNESAAAPNLLFFVP